jgi:hypothetical protein
MHPETHPESFPKLIPTTLNLLSTLFPRSFSSVHEVSLLPFLLISIPVSPQLLPPSHHRPRRLPGPQGRLCFLREGRLRPCHFTLTRWFMVRPILHCDRWCRLGSANRRGYHRFCDRPQQRRCGPCVLPRRKRHHRWQRQRYCGSYRNWRERSSESRTPCTDVLVLQV